MEQEMICTCARDFFAGYRRLAVVGVRWGLYFVGGKRDEEAWPVRQLQTAVICYHKSQTCGSGDNGVYLALLSKIMTMPFTDYYKTLGISSDATIDDIKSAYRKLSKKFHPDLNQGDKYFEERFKEIQEAFEVLSNKNRHSEYKKLYDNFYNRNTNTENRGHYKSHEPKQEKKEEKDSTHIKPRANRPNKTNPIGGILITIVILFILGLFRNYANKRIVENALGEYHSTITDTANTPETFSTQEKEQALYSNAIKDLDTCIMSGILKNKLFYGEPNFGQSPSIDRKEYSYILELYKPIKYWDPKNVDSPLLVTSIHILDIDHNDDLSEYIGKPLTIKSTIVYGHTGHHHAPLITWNLIDIQYDNTDNRRENDEHNQAVFVGEVIDVDPEFNSGGIKIKVKRRVSFSQLEKDYNNEVVKLNSEEWYNIDFNEKLYELKSKEIRFTCYREGSGGYLWLGDYSLENSLR